MALLRIDGAEIEQLVKDTLAGAPREARATSIRLTNFLSLDEARRQTCHRLDATVQCFRETAESIGLELSDWRLVPNSRHLDLLLEVRRHRSSTLRKIMRVKGTLFQDM